MSGENLTEEDREAVRAYREKHGEGPFIAADAVVVSADDHVLLVRRSSPPLKGSWAFPGGFVDVQETFLQAARRELAEETSLDLGAFGGSEAAKPATQSVRDAPDRDPRARIVSVAFLFRLRTPHRSIDVRHGDDAADARWVSLKERLESRNFYADHLAILGDFDLLPVSNPSHQHG